MSPGCGGELPRDRRERPGINRPRVEWSRGCITRLKSPYTVHVPRFERFERSPGLIYTYTAKGSLTAKPGRSPGESSTKFLSESEEPQYSGLAQLRSQIGQGNDEAIIAVYEAGTDRDEVMQSEPSAETVKKLRDANVIPGEDDEHNPAQDRHEEIVALLEEIAANTGGPS